jgi:cell fate regulator YaaT (PSP1 superfamily)
MCCLKYEQDGYEELLKDTPNQGSIVDTAEGRGMVHDVNLLTGVLKVKLSKNEQDAPTVAFKKDDVKLIKMGQIRTGREDRALKALERN